jgi:hypothetical protein
MDRRDRAMTVYRPRMRACFVVAAVVAVASPSTAGADSTGTVGLGGGFLIGGDASGGFGHRGEGAAGVLTGVRAHFVPLTRKTRVNIGPDLVLARWTTDVGEHDGTLAQIGLRVMRGSDQAGMHLAGRVGVWAPGERAVGAIGLGGHTRVVKRGRLSLGWEIGAAAWRQRPLPVVPGEIPATFKTAAGKGENVVHCQSCADTARPQAGGGGFPFVGVHGWFEISIDL